MLLVLVNVFVFVTPQNCGGVFFFFFSEYCCPIIVERIYS